MEPHSSKTVRYTGVRERGKGWKCEPKKGSGGGKYTWGRPGSERQEMPVDPNDPNYDPDEMGTPVEFKVLEEDLTDDALKHLLEPVLLEYFENGEIDDVLEFLRRLNYRSNAHVIVETIIKMSFDRKGAEKELASKLISDLVSSHSVPEPAVENAYLNLLRSLSDLKLDCPYAADHLGNFMGRSVGDDCIPPSFVQGHPALSKDFKDADIHEAIHKAHVLISTKQGMSRLDQVWGIDFARYPIRFVVKEIGFILREYLSSRDAQEAYRGLHELAVPHFHHEVVYELVVLALEHGAREEEASALRSLLASLAKSGLLSVGNVNAGFQRVFDEISDLVLDIPRAHTWLKKFLEESIKEGIVEPGLMAQLPEKPRYNSISVDEASSLSPSS